MTETVVSIIASFLGGALVASVSFMFAFVGRLTKVETTLSNLCTRVDKLSNNQSVCPFHGELDKK